MKAVYMRERAGEKGFNPKDADKYVDTIATVLQPIEDEVERKRREWHSTNASGSDDAPAATPTGESKPHESEVDVDEGCESFKTYGLFPRDKLALIECDDFRPGEVVVIWIKERKRWEVGRFVEYTDTEDWGRCPYIRQTRDAYTFNRHAHMFYRVKTITRTIAVERPTNAEGEEATKKQKIEALRKRLDEIDADDITNSTAILALERQIYDLEHSKDLDDWSAWEE
ncbi:MAG TPA: hypothetical protein VE713_01830 [Pyrinomonadaceae bacterium]|nr:hypothetical protein [Pyrinomonadaceae bacterium]